MLYVTFALIVFISSTSKAFEVPLDIDHIWMGVSTTYSDYEYSDRVTSYYAGLPIPFDPIKEKVAFYPGNSDEEFKSDFYKPTLFKEISTCGELAKDSDAYNCQTGLARLRKSSIFIYSPMKTESVSYENGFGPDKIFNLSTLQWQTISAPDFKKDARYSQLISGNGWFPYENLYFALSPSGKKATRLFRLKGGKTEDVVDALVTWDISNGTIEHIAEIPMVFIDENAHGYFNEYIRYYGEIDKALPATPFYTSETTLMLPVVYLASDNKDKELKYFFQPIDVSSKDSPHWLFTTCVEDGRRIFSINSDVSTFVYISTRFKEDYIKKDLLQSMPAYHFYENYATSYNKINFPAFSFDKVATPKSWKHWDGQFGNTIIVNGRPNSFITGDLKETNTEEVAYQAVPSFYPSVFRPFPFGYSDQLFHKMNTPLYNDLSFYKPGGESNYLRKIGTDIRAMWQDEALPEDSYLTISVTNNNKLGYKEGYGHSLSQYEPIQFVTSPEITWNHHALTVTKQSPQKKFEVASELCQKLPDIDIELCDRKFYDVTDPKKTYPGNFFVKNGPELKLKVTKDDDNKPTTECWYQTCQGTRIKEYVVDLPTKPESQLIINIYGTYDCTKTATTTTCSATYFSVSSFVKSKTSQYTLDELQLPKSFLW